jgi:hypothetical protein
MIVHMNENVTPLCDRHYRPMELGQFGESNLWMSPSFIAHKCMVSACTRIYQHGSRGYRDITDSISSKDVLNFFCEEDDMTMYIAEVNADGTQLWRCGQSNCNYSAQINPNERFRVMVNPVEVREENSAEDRPFAFIEATGPSGARWIGPTQPWHVTMSILASFGQNQTQLSAIRNSLTKETPGELAGMMVQLLVTEHQLSKAGLKRFTNRR